MAAQAAATAGTAVYTIGYGSETSGGCPIGCKKYSASVTRSDGATWGPGDQPCHGIGGHGVDRGEFLFR